MLSGLCRETFAEQCHKSWSGWMKYLFSKSSYQEDGSVIIPAPLVARWTRQMNTDYGDLEEEEKDSDRAEADAFLDLPYPGAE